MSDNEKAKEPEKTSQIVTFRVPKSDLEKFDKTYQGDRAERLRQMIQNAIKQPGAPTQFNGDAKRNERLRLLKAENSLHDLLQDTRCYEKNPEPNGYSDLIRIAKENGSDEGFTKNVDKLLEALNGEEAAECFGERLIETMIEYVEAVLARRKVDVEMRASRQDRLKGANT